MLTRSALPSGAIGPEPLAVAYHSKRLYVRAYCLWEIEELRANRGGGPTELARVTARYPHTAAAASFNFTPDPDRQFEAGLDLMLRGLQIRK